MTEATKEEDGRRELSDEVLRRLSIRDIRLSKLNAELKNAAMTLPLRTVASLVATEFELQQDLVIYHLGYGFTTSDREKKPIWSTQFTLSVSFGLKNPKEKISDEALQAFGKQGVLEVAHPYARELVHHMTARMRVPTFLLEVLQLDR